ncbi:hypothetical protein B3286c2_1046 [Brucella vulpis]|nr:hypothetical protein BF3285c2_1050 [Brucella vulpis]CUW52053.1 hypothetical protein B3286c2_1046 [Brucella vulpis]
MKMAVRLVMYQSSPCFQTLFSKLSTKAGVYMNG